MWEWATILPRGGIVRKSRTKSTTFVTILYHMRITYLCRDYAVALVKWLSTRPPQCSSSTPLNCLGGASPTGGTSSKPTVYDTSLPQLGLSLPSISWRPLLRITRTQRRIRIPSVTHLLPATLDSTLPTLLEATAPPTSSPYQASTRTHTQPDR